MFNLGYKQIVINSSAVVVEDAGSTGDNTKITVEGFGTFYTSAAAIPGFATAGSSAVAGVYPYTAPTSVVGDVWTVNVRIKSSRLLSEIFPNNFDTIVYQSAATAGTNAAAFGAAMVAGQEVVWSAGEEMLIWNAAGTTVTFAKGYEGFEIDSITVQKGSADPVKLTVAAPSTAPSEGVGTGKQIEAEVRNATFDNIDPYGIQFGGNTPVDVRALYTTIMWETASDCEVEDASDMTTGWADHEMANSGGGVNTDNGGEPRKYIAYVNQATAAAAITSLTKLTSNLAVTT